MTRKKESPFISLKLNASINSEIEQKLMKVLGEINSFITNHNDKTDSLDKDKEEAKQKLILHYTAKFLKEEIYFGLKNDIENLEKEIGKSGKLNMQINQLTTDIENIERQIKASAIGANRINEYLNTFFGDNRLRIQLTGKGNYKLYRNDQIAKNLSTGEKNIISLIYFFAKLEESNFDFHYAVIFIDDPVSSLDCNHLHRVYAFISKKLKDCGQLFITTHNFDFFNLLKDMYQYDMRNQNGSFYLIKKVNQQNNHCSIIENLPELLLKYKSEYNYLFSILKRYNDFEDKCNFDQLYIIPNILRRFMELYLFMKYPDGKKFKDKVEKFFQNTEENLKITTLKIADEYSHEENPEHAIKFPDINELPLAVDFILKTLKEKDNEHYQALSDSFNVAGG